MKSTVQDRFDNVITNQNIVEVPASSYHDITDKDMIIYHINDDKEAHSIEYKING